MITYSALLNLEVLVLLPIQLDFTCKLEIFFHDFHSLEKKTEIQTSSSTSTMPVEFFFKKSTLF
jgi:hypothetical protein